jgi:hypothetical protein
LTVRTHLFPFILHLFSSDSRLCFWFDVAGIRIRFA